MRNGNDSTQEGYWEDKHRPEQRFFRCPVPVENSAATLRFSGTKVPVELHESSLDGFAVLVQQKHVSKLRLGPRWVLQSATQRSEVWPQWLYCAPDGHVQVGLRRLQDLTPLRARRRWLGFAQSGTRRRATWIIAVVALLAAVAISLPTLGDFLGNGRWTEQTLRELLGGAMGRFHWRG